MLFEQFLPDVAAGILLREERDRALEFHKTFVKLVVRQSLKRVTQKDVAGDIFRRIPIDRNPGEVQVGLVLVEVLQGHILLRRHRHDPRGHHIAGLDIVQFHYVLDDLVLVGVDHALLGSDVRHRRHLFPADRRLVLILGHQVSDQPDNDDERPHQNRQERNSRCHKAHQTLPI